jgi:hypothetical protein
VLVDGDEDAGRKARLAEVVADLFVPKVIAVAVQEFEAWLIADHRAVCEVLAAAPAQPREPERMARRQAKELLVSWMGDRDGSGERGVRITLARTCDLDVVRRRCSAFEQFLRDLGSPRA